MLSKRLVTIANLIPENKVVYDVGSDHGLLPCFLIEKRKAKKAYASDNKQGPLNKAIENINKYKLQDKVITVLADGIDKIADDVDIITIAGMGFYTVKHILDNKDLSKYEMIIVQVNKNTNELRKWISDHKYKIINECVVCDDFYYEIVVFNGQNGPVLSSLEIEYGPINLLNRNDEFVEYLKDKRAKLLKINKKSGKDLYAKKLDELDRVIEGILV